MLKHLSDWLLIKFKWLIKYLINEIINPVAPSSDLNQVSYLEGGAVILLTF